ncbi:pentatricopeptide repeat-containing protein At1g74630 [Cynara cardunculus var. scolymus]|uniref:DYW domain-containing protein n=1 Tax=Cynara cardunculus var. scolymus TaxID=59895 RepID=A0A103YKD0_CYNCS|nr:pentatricopeptide repeat-containing protein At1g74630 [Cynara cardunculus var. scolymus]XP_024967547.1 pentatricopeptide repeat-containing protein At1g74630 [Cynara cardunculus var. scolymus]XP_024967548.1 pentatricopeptide repeat-containing protein At1g74630 [Cynara cardunculus var. scolymus]XP_024967549.1 pentatricopeptide repeat-containing protein At1g74630 [Cynara cardunculus var. scolymus]XP_024967550.1 pentatricopeptide repeat-containing protein At1g74630 [Cynara cardunculus var. scoly
MVNGNIVEPLCLSVLKRCKNLRSVKQVHAHIVKTGISDAFVTGNLILHCAVLISDALHYAHSLLHHFPNPDAFMYNTLIRGFSDSDHPYHSLTTFIDMRRNSDNSPDSFSFAFVLKAAANLRSYTTGIQLHSQAIFYGLDTHLYVGTTLVSMYAECGWISHAGKVFDKMFEPNIVAWNAMITAYLRCCDVRGAEKLYKQMPVRDLISSNIMLAGYMKFGELQFAKKLFFHEMRLKDDVSWSTMIVGFSHNGCFDEAFDLFVESQRLGLRSNEVSLTGILSVCAQAGAFEFGKVLHGYIEKSGLVWITSVNNALLDTYSKCGNINMAQLVFKRMPGKKSIVSWTTMVAGLAMQGYGEVALKVFHQMEESGIKPDGITFISVLYACSHAGLIDHGDRYFSMMKNHYGIEPTFEHYGCMVDLYGRAGDLQKAYNFITQMPIKPNAVIWRTLLGACSIHGNVDLAEEVQKTLSELDPNDSGDHVLLSNIYAVAGKWKDVLTVRKSMHCQRLTKTPGWSMIEVDKVMYSFVAGEKQNEVTDEAYKKLGEIMLRLRVDGGYVAEVNGSVLHDIEEEEKEDAVATHSEKLALAFGMSRLCDGGVIRIVKNLRVCKDCHTVMKLVSDIFRLEIVLRDRSRFHCFKDGCCSCRDYW